MAWKRCCVELVKRPHVELEQVTSIRVRQPQQRPCDGFTYDMVDGKVAKFASRHEVVRKHVEGDVGSGHSGFRKEPPGRDLVPIHVH